jgi:SAM-dependent methyltransferase
VANASGIRETKSAGLLPPREAFELWARSYDEGSLLLALDELALGFLGAAEARGRLLDVACGTAHRISGRGGGTSFGIDLVPEMLARQGTRRGLAVADMRAVPFSADSFDTVWCRLAAGYVQEVSLLYRELARVCRPAGSVVVTDFHPEGLRAGLTRTFRDAGGGLHEITSTPHPPAAHENGALRSGLERSARVDLGADPRTRHLFAAAGELPRFERLRGIPLVLGLSFRKPA